MIRNNISVTPSVTRRMILICFLLTLGSNGCGSEQMPEPTACLVNDTPSFQLGTGELGFVPIEDGDDLEMISGPQGGCHFWLALRTDGFAQRRFDVRYDVVYADSSTTTGSRSSQRVKLSLREEDPAGGCEYSGYYAYLIEPWKFKDREVRINVTVADDLGRSSMTSKTVWARWPQEQPGRPSEDLCGVR